MRLLLARLLVCLPLLAGGCALVEPEREEARLSLTLRLPEPLGPEMVEVTVSEGASRRTSTGGDFRHQGGASYDGPVLETALRGTLRVSYRLVAPGGLVASRGEVALPIREDWQWSLSLQAGTTDPRGSCFGCQGSRAFELAEPFRSAGADSVYLVWGGHTISSPELY